jgi:hypothetical protein
VLVSLQVTVAPLHVQPLVPASAEPPSGGLMVIVPFGSATQLTPPSLVRV